MTLIVDEEALDLLRKVSDQKRIIARLDEQLKDLEFQKRTAINELEHHQRLLERLTSNVAGVAVPSPGDPLAQHTRDIAFSRGK